MARGGFPTGGGNMNNMLKQAQKMQQEMLRMQKELEEKTITAVSGGGAVSATVSGKKRLTSLEIKPEVIDPDDAEMLQDLILVAVNDAISQIDEMSEREMGKLTGGLPLF